jgi:hypothetical protein
MSKTISTIDLNDAAGTATLDATVVAPEEDDAVATEAVDIDTDELESLLTDLKATKKRNKAPTKKRERKAKITITAPPVVEEIAPVEVPIVEEPEVEVEAPVEVKPRRKYVRKAPVVPSTIVEEPATPHSSPVVEPAKRTAAAMIEEMQRAERALRYQMRKNKMQTLITQAF